MFASKAKNNNLLTLTPIHKMALKNGLRMRLGRITLTNTVDHEKQGPWYKSVNYELPEVVGVSDPIVGTM